VGEAKMTNSKVIGVIGLGNAGLPILNNLNKTKKYQLIAYDIDEHKLNLLPENISKASSIIFMDLVEEIQLLHTI
jgi:UDP-N-acetyl-D-mannosaminuronate dehydrogenase